MGMGIRQASKRALNSVKRLTGLGEYWFWMNPREVAAEIPIRPLIYPHRYDILIRKSYFDFYAGQRELYRRDFEAYVDMAQQHQYYDWFIKVLMVRFEAASVGDAARTRALFSHRLRESAALHDSIADNGFDTAFPIVPFTGVRIKPMDSGRTSDEVYFMGDGCHRLACLMSLGYDCLPRKMVRIKCFSTLVPLDNTALLQDCLAIEWPDEYMDGRTV